MKQSRYLGSINGYPFIKTKYKHKDVLFHDPYYGSYPVDIIGYWYGDGDYRKLYYVYKVPFTGHTRSAYYQYFDIDPKDIIK